MILIDCPACGDKTSPDAAACPHCGHPVSINKRKKYKWMMSIGMIGALFGLAMSAIGNSPMGAALLILGLLFYTIARLMAWWHDR